MRTLLLITLSTITQAAVIHPLPWEDYVIIPVSAIALSVFGGIMSGLTVGLMSIDELKMKSKLISGTLEEKIFARRILPILKDHHLLLVTLLLANAIALETLPLLLNEMVGGLTAVIVSVILTLILAEVIPQALCIGPLQIPIASTFSTMVRALIFILYPISYPIARLLDKIIGSHEEKQYTDEELKTLFTLQYTSNFLTKDQVGIIHNSIELKTKIIKDVYIPLSQVFSVSNELSLNSENLEIISSKGFSRVPVRVSDREFRGILMVKELIGAEGKCVKEVRVKEANYIDVEVGIVEAIEAFQGAGCYCVMATEAGKVVGIVTLHDMFKEVIRRDSAVMIKQSSTYSENDIYDKKPGIFRKIYNKLTRKQPANSLLVEEFQLAEKDPLNNLES